MKKRRGLRIKVVSPRKEKEVVVPNASKPSPPVQTKHPKKKERKKGKLQKK